MSNSTLGKTAQNPIKTTLDFVNDQAQLDKMLMQEGKKAIKEIHLLDRDVALVFREPRATNLRTSIAQSFILGAYVTG